MPWPQLPLRRAARFAYGNSLADRLREDGIVPVFGSNGQVGTHAVANTLAPAIVIGRKGSFGKIQYSESPVFAIDTTFYVDARTTAANLRWLHYALQTLHLDRLSEDVGVPGLSREKAYSELIPVPPERAQHGIAGYLDRETDRIDRLISAKRRMVALLEERKGGLREHLVLDSRQIGIAIRLGHLLREVDDRLGDRNPPPLLSVSIHHGVIPFAEANPDRAPRADDLVNYKCCQADDLVLNRMRAFQGGIGRAPAHGIVSPDYAVLRPLQSAVSAYLHHLLRSPWFVSEMEARLRGIGGSAQGNVRTPRVNWDDLRTVAVPAPPVEEQTHLAQQLDESLGRVVAMQSTLDSQIDLFQERRHALVTAAVTGRIDIPGAAAA